MERRHRGEVAGGNGFNRYFKTGKIIGVGEEIAMIQHVDPDLPIREDFGGEGILQDLTRSDGGENDTAFLEVVLRSFPRQFEGIFKPLDDAFLLQLVQRCRPIF